MRTLEPLEKPDPTAWSLRAAYSQSPPVPCPPVLTSREPDRIFQCHHRLRLMTRDRLRITHWMTRLSASSRAPCFSSSNARMQLLLFIAAGRCVRRLGKISHQGLATMVYPLRGWV